MRRVVSQFLFLFFAALWPGLSFAASETYEGKLFPRTNDTPISITVEMEELGGFLTGKVRTSLPLTGNIDSGRNVAGYCNLVSKLSSSITLRLYGSCSSKTFEGSYTLGYTQSKSVARGTFLLTKKVVRKPENGLSSADVTASNMLVCIKANTRCLAACPRGDTNVEYLCANHCRTKMQACKGKASKIDDIDLE